MKAKEILKNVCKEEHYVTCNYEVCKFKYFGEWYTIRVNVYSDATCQYYIQEIEGSETGYVKALYNFMNSIFDFGEIELFGNNICKFNTLFG